MKFKNVFIVILTLVLIQQFYSLGLLIHYGFFDENKPQAYYYFHEIGGFIWFILLTAAALYHMRIRNVNIGAVLNIEIDAFKTALPDVLKYFAGCALFVIFISYFETSTELDLEHKTLLLTFLTFGTVVILAPVTEEIAFRGYLYTAMLSKFKRKKERIVVNAMLFAAAHVFVFEFFLGATVPYYIFVLGYFLAKLYEEHRSIVPCVLLHFLNNGLVFVIDLIKLNNSAL